MKRVDDVLSLIGGTPLVRLPRLSPAGGATLWAKLETQNPMGCVKERAALAMVESAERDAGVRPGVTCFVAPSSGNLGVGLAMVAAVKGYDVIIVMPSRMSAEKRMIMERLGARVVLSPAEDGAEGARSWAKRIVDAGGSRMRLVDQFTDVENAACHERTTGQELLTQMEGLTFDAFVAGVGSSGTLTGCARALRKALGERVRIVAVEPAGSPVLSSGEPLWRGVRLREGAEGARYDGRDFRHWRIPGRRHDHVGLSCSRCPAPGGRSFVSQGRECTRQRRRRRFDQVGRDVGGTRMRARGALEALRSFPLDSQPTIVFDLDVMQENVRLLADAGREQVTEFLFPVKAFSRPEILRLVDASFDGFDVSNAFELDHVLSATERAPGTISICNPGLDKADLDACLAKLLRKGFEPVLRVVCESKEQALWVRHHSSPRVEIVYRLSSDGLLPATGDQGAMSRFGIRAAEFEAAHVDAAGERFAGFHVHSGMSAQNDLATIERLGGGIAALCDRIRISPRIVDLGGGLWNATPEGVGDVLRRIRTRFPCSTTLVLEPGRLISRDAGFACGRVRAARSEREREIRILGLSRACHLKWTSPLLLNALGARVGNETPVEKSAGPRIEIVGPTCFEDDRFCETIIPAEGAQEVLPVGALVVFGSITGYAAEWNASFNGIPPAEVKFVRAATVRAAFS
jgi:cysteine synthase A